MDDLTHIINSKHHALTSDEQHSVSLIYTHLKKIAHSQKFKFSQSELHTTALVNEAWLKIFKKQKHFNDRNHFYATSALAMRQILLNQAKKQIKQGTQDSIEEEQHHIPHHDEAVWLLELEKHLKSLQQYSKRLEQIFVLRYFGGMSIEEISNHMGLSDRTINREWKKAKLMISAAMGR